MTKSGRKLLAEISKHVTFPLLLFTSILYCEQDGGMYRGVDTKCPNMFSTITASWIILLWPFLITTMGIVDGKAMAAISGADDKFKFAAMTAVAFGNSTGLPLTFVAIIHNAADSNSPLSLTDPAIFISVYLIFYPILQWSLGSWLLEGPSQGNNGEGNDNQHATNGEFKRLGAEPLLDNADIQIITDDAANLREKAGLVNGPNIVNRTTTSLEKSLRTICKQMAQPAIIASVIGLIIACIAFT